jgi:uncharacterized protein (DUF342 family)
MTSPEPERLRIRIDEDGLAAHVAIGAGPALARAALDAALAAAGVVAGLDASALELAAGALAVESPALDDYCVAHGRAAQDPTSDVLVLAEPIGPTAGSLRPDESLDYRERRLIVPVTAGDELGRIVPGEPGEAGFDVRGKELLPMPAPPLAVAHGDGVVREETGILRATRTGARTVDKAGALDVVALHVHAAAVDLHSGNLDTDGSLEIARDVSDGMSVRAGVDLSIKGTVEAARIEAGGSIEIGGGVIGGEAGQVRARGNLKLRHALSARLFAGGTLEILRSVSTSELHAREISVGGALLGDRAFAESRITVRDAGSPAGGPCLLRVAHPFESIPAETAEGPDARALARARLREGPDRLSARKARDTRKGRGERPSSPGGPELGLQRSFRKRQRALQADARIEVQGTAHAGCRIDFGSRPLVLEEAVRAKVFRFDVERDEIVAEEM